MTETERIRQAQMLKAAQEDLESGLAEQRRNFLARHARVRFLSYVKAGFTEAQALELCKEAP